MPTSEARITANRINSLKSTGPKTVEGKTISRRNGLKHGLTGDGIVLKAEDSSEVELRDAELQAELAPKSALGQILVRQMATLSVRIERSSRQETASIDRRVRHAREDFDQERFDEVDRHFDLLNEQPRIAVRKLLKSPEGVERLVVAWRELREALTQSPEPTWTPWHQERAENLTGLRKVEASGSEISAFSKAIRGDFSEFVAGQDLVDEERSRFARFLLIKRIDEEIACLEELYETFDFAMIALDRLEAPDRALFDPSREACLARRYEAEASRGFFRALKELRQVETEAAERPDPDVNPNQEEVCDPLASSWERRAPKVREPEPREGFARPMSESEVFASTSRLDCSARDLTLADRS